MNSAAPEVAAWEPVRGLDWAFRVPPSWPESPPLWRPWNGWRPPAEWPASPAGHSWWERTQHSRRSRSLITVGVLLGPLLVLGGLIGVGVVMTGANGCGFDLPPGDVAEYPVVNDTTSTVTITECDESSCTHAVQDTSEALAPGQRTTMRTETCSGLPFGVVDGSSPRSSAAACFAVTAADPQPARTYYVSQAAPCG